MIYLYRLLFALALLAVAARSASHLLTGLSTLGNQGSRTFEEER